MKVPVPPLGSIEESLAYWGKFEATHCKNLLNAPRSFHPNDNMGTIIISQKDFIKFLEAMGNGMMGAKPRQKYMFFE